MTTFADTFVLLTLICTFLAEQRHFLHLNRNDSAPTKQPATGKTA
jgi:hypothetical protein